MRRRTAQLFRGDHFVRDSFHNVGTGHKHVAGVFHHKDEVSHRGAINSTTRTRPHDHADLRDNAAGHNVALEHLAVGRKAVNTLLDARAATVVQANHGCAVLHGHIHDLTDFLGMSFRDRATQNCEIL